MHSFAKACLSRVIRQFVSYLGATVLMEVNDLGFVATILFILVPTVFLLILYIQTNKVGGNS
ncbi:photosystem II reaction center protein PsbM [Xenococcus sp. PCC 7305]|nr:photosystem II reaction center protein PsbM [Xenococcus sp. PCC 7305]